MKSGIGLWSGLRAACTVAGCPDRSAPRGRFAEARPNILFIMTDQHRWDCLGANGNKIIKTPNLDRLARASANFTHAFVQAPVCVPSRASFFTGRYPHSHKNRVNYTPLGSRGNPDAGAPQSRRLSNGAPLASSTLMPPTVEEARRTGFDRVELHDAVPYLDRFSDYVKWRNERDPLKKIHYRRYAKDIEPGRIPFARRSRRIHDTAWVGLRTRHHLRELASATSPSFSTAPSGSRIRPSKCRAPTTRCTIMSSSNCQQRGAGGDIEAAEALAES